MSDLDRVLTRIRELPEDKQAEAARLLEAFIEDEHSGSLLTDAQWAEVKARLATPAELLDHDDVVSAIRAKYGA